MSRKLYNAIYSILVNEAGAKESWRDHFVDVFMDDPPREYRFQGSLGFGGKLWLERPTALVGRSYRVTCYPEDETPERKEIVTRVNGLLRQILEEEKMGAFE